MNEEMDIVNDMLVVSDLNNAIRNYCIHFPDVRGSEIHKHLYDAIQIVNDQYHMLGMKLQELKEKPIKAKVILKVVDKIE